MAFGGWLARLAVAGLAAAATDGIHSRGYSRQQLQLMKPDILRTLGATPTAE